MEAVPYLSQCCEKVGKFTALIYDVSSKPIDRTINTQSIFISGGRQKGKTQQSPSQPYSDKWLCGSSAYKTLLVDHVKDQVIYFIHEKGHWSYCSKAILGQSASPVVIAAVIYLLSNTVSIAPPCYCPLTRLSASSLCPGIFLLIATVKKTKENDVRAQIRPYQVLEKQPLLTFTLWFYQPHGQLQTVPAVGRAGLRDWQETEVGNSK